MSDKERKLAERKARQIAIALEQKERIWKDYKKNWTTPFPDGPQKIFAVSGNTDAGHKESALSIIEWPAVKGFNRQTGNDIPYDHFVFSTWKEFAQWHVDNFERVSWLHWGEMNDSDDEDSAGHSKMYRRWRRMRARKLLQTMTDPTATDPVLFVTESTSLLFWLKKVRGF